MTFSDDFVVPTFSDATIGSGQRWSTWPATTPTERGPRPFPNWIVTNAAAIDTEFGIVKSGKEADVFLIERAVPDDVALVDSSGQPTLLGRHSVLAAKRYRGPDTTDFHRGAQYREGRRTRNTRDGRAMARGSSHGRSVQAGLWAWAEFEALGRMYERGVPVPYPVQISGTEILMDFIGDRVDGTWVAAPRLAQTKAEGAELWPLFEQVTEILIGFARAGYAHGDLSPYNLLVHKGRVVVIDVPQLVDVVSNPNGVALLERDCRNVCDWFARRGFVRDVEHVFAECLGEVFG